MTLDKTLERLEEEYGEGFTYSDWETDEQLQKRVNHLFQELDLREEERDDFMEYIENGEYDSAREQYGGDDL